MPARPREWNESFAIVPVESVFDVAAIETFIQALPCTARDKIAPQVFMFTDSQEMLESVVDSRDQDPTRFSISVTLVQVEPLRILVTPGAGGVAAARECAQWLMRRNRVRLIDWEMNDVTAECESNLDLLFVAS